MTILHVGDLHIGKTMQVFSMLEDQSCALEQIVKYIKSEKPDALLISGDVYDKQIPQAEAVTLFDKFITEIAQFNLNIFIISGNHDSPQRLSFASSIIEKSGVHIYGVFEGGLRKIVLNDKFGKINVYMLPFIKPSLARGFFDFEIENSHDAVKAAINSTPIDYKERNILVAHQYVVNAGVEPERCESEIGAVGGLDHVDVSLVEQFDYVALGHVHGPQKIKSDHIRYSGSLLKYSFSECLHEKSIVKVIINEKGNVEISLLPIFPLRDMRKIEGPLSVLTSTEVSSAGNTEDYLHVTLTDEEEIIDAIGRLRIVYPNVMYLGFKNSRTAASGELEEIAFIEGKTPQELFEEFFALRNGTEMKEEQSNIINDMLGRQDDQS